MLDAPRRICVFCGSAAGTSPAFAEAAIELGVHLAACGIGLVYGGASVGLMGIVADAAVEAGGEVIGVIPGSLRDREIAHPGLSELVIVDDMHTRKRRMYDLSDGFCALPGGFGTYDELFEAVTWSQLGLHAEARRKIVALLDVEGFWGPFVSFVDSAVENGFVTTHNRDLIRLATTPSQVVSTVLI